MVQTWCMKHILLETYIFVLYRTKKHRCKILNNLNQRPKDSMITCSDIVAKYFLNPLSFCHWIKTQLFWNLYNFKFFCVINILLSIIFKYFCCYISDMYIFDRHRIISLKSHSKISDLFIWLLYIFYVQLSVKMCFCCYYHTFLWIWED